MNEVYQPEVIRRVPIPFSLLFRMGASFYLSISIAINRTRADSLAVNSYMIDFFLRFVSQRLSLLNGQMAGFSLFPEFTECLRY